MIILYLRLCPLSFHTRRRHRPPPTTTTTTTSTTTHNTNPRAAQSKKPDDAKVKHVIYWGPGADAASLDKLKKMGMTAMSWQEALDAGAAKPADPVPPKPEDYCTIMCECRLHCCLLLALVVVVVVVVSFECV